MTFEELQALAKLVKLTLQIASGPGVPPGAKYALSDGKETYYYGSPGDVEKALRQLAGDKIAPAEHPEFTKLMPTYRWEDAYQPVYRTIKSKMLDEPDTYKFIRWEPTEVMVEFSKRLQAAATPSTKNKQITPKTTTINGFTYYATEEDATGDPIWQKGASTPHTSLNQALEDAVQAKNPDWDEINRLITMRDALEKSEPGFMQKEQQKALAQANWERQFGATEEQRRTAQAQWDKQFGANQRQNAFSNALEAARFGQTQEQLALQRQQSPGDWLNWWMMMRPDLNPTAGQFQQFGADRFANQVAGVLNSQSPVSQTGGETPAISSQSQNIFEAGVRPGGAAQAQMVLHNKTVQDEIDRRFKQWASAWDAANPGALPEASVVQQIRTEIEAQVKKEYPVPNIFPGGTGGYGTSNAAIYDEMQRRMKEGTFLPLYREPPVVKAVQWTPEQQNILDTAHPSDVEAYKAAFRRQQNMLLAGAPYPLAQGQQKTIDETADESRGSLFQRPGQIGTRVNYSQPQTLQQAAASQPGLNWLKVLLAQGQPAGARQIPSIPGAPPFMSGQTLNSLLPSQSEAFKSAVQSTGIPWMDYYQQWKKTQPTGEVSPSYGFSPLPAYSFSRGR